MLTLGLAALIVGYLLLTAGFHSRNADGSAFSPLQQLRAAFGGRH